MKPNQFLQKHFLLYGLIGAFAVATISGCKKEDIQPPSDDEISTTTSANAETIKPVVKFTFPVAGATVADSITVMINATDASGIKSVRLTVDGIVIGTKTVAPYNFGWNTKKVMNGTHLLQAKATDNSGNPKTKGITVNVLNPGIIPLEQDLISLINAERAKVGVPALVLDTRIMSAARAHSTDEAVHNFQSHTGSDGSTLGSRLNAAGYPWTQAGENLAAGQTTAQAVFDGWRADVAKLSIMRDPNFKEIGVGCAYTSSNTATFHQFWTLNVGTTQ